MGNYVSQAELKSRFDGDAEVAFLTDTEETGVPDTGVLDDCIEAAEADINSRIGKRYKTPVVISGNTELTALLKRKTLDLAEYYLLARGPSVSDQKEKQALRVYEWANAVSKGEFILSGAVTPPSTTSRDPLASWTGSDRDLSDVPTRIFSRETMDAL